MAGPHLGEALATCLEVMRDPDSRQRLSAAGLIAQWATNAPADETQSAQGNVRILVVQSNDLDELERQQREYERKRLEAG